MAAAVAKAPEKSKVPGNPQVLYNSSFHSDRGGLPLFNLPEGTVGSLSHTWTV